MAKVNIEGKSLRLILIFKLCIVFGLLFHSCSTNKYLAEEQIYKTKVYVGKFVASHPLSRTTQVETEQACFTVKGDPHIPDNAWCYIRIVRDFRFHPDIRWKMNDQYLTWEGGNEEYRLTKNLKIQ